MGVLENGKYKEFERVSFDELRKTLVYISIAEHLGIFNKCETEYVYCDGKYILRVSQDVNPKDELFTLNDIKSGFNSYLESVNKESESSDDEYVEVKKKNDDDE